MEPKELYYTLDNKKKELLSNYTLRGDIFKRVSSDIVDELQGVAKGVLGELNEDGSVTVYQLTYNESKMTVKEYLHWNDGEVERLNKKGRGTNVTYVMSPERDQGTYITRENSILIALRA